MANGFSQTYEKFAWADKVYHQVQAQLSYEPLYLKDQKYYLVKVDLRTRTGQKVFKDPMLLITNYVVHQSAMAQWVFHRYLKRSKIEGVFKFLKGQLGWESFQVRDWQSIENIIVLAFFIGGYFYESESELVNNADMQEICQLGKGKGKVTKTFFLRGLAQLVVWQQMQAYFDQKGVSKQQIQELMRFIT